MENFPHRNFIIFKNSIFFFYAIIFWNISFHIPKLFKAFKTHLGKPQNSKKKKMSFQFLYLKILMKY